MVAGREGSLQKLVQSGGNSAGKADAGVLRGGKQPLQPLPSIQHLTQQLIGSLIAAPADVERPVFNQVGHCPAYAGGFGK